MQTSHSTRASYKISASLTRMRGCLPSVMRVTADRQGLSDIDEVDRLDLSTEGTRRARAHHICD